MRYNIDLVMRVVGEIGEVIGYLFRHLEWEAYIIPESWEAISRSCELNFSYRIDIMDSKLEFYQKNGAAEYIDELVKFLENVVEHSPDKGVCLMTKIGIQINEHIEKCVYPEPRKALRKNYRALFDCIDHDQELFGPRSYFYLPLEPSRERRSIIRYDSPRIKLVKLCIGDWNFENYQSEKETFEEIIMETGYFDFRADIWDAIQNNIGDVLSYTEGAMETLLRIFAQMDEHPIPLIRLLNLLFEHHGHFEEKQWKHILHELHPDDFAEDKILVRENKSGFFSFDQVDDIEASDVDATSDEEESIDDMITIIDSDSFVEEDELADSSRKDEVIEVHDDATERDATSQQYDQSRRIVSDDELGSQDMDIINQPTKKWSDKIRRFRIQLKPQHIILIFFGICIIAIIIFSAYKAFTSPEPQLWIDLLFGTIITASGILIAAYVGFKRIWKIEDDRHAKKKAILRRLLHELQRTSRSLLCSGPHETVITELAEIEKMAGTEYVSETVHTQILQLKDTIKNYNELIKTSKMNDIETVCNETKTIIDTLIEMIREELQ